MRKQGRLFFAALIIIFFLIPDKVLSQDNGINNEVVSYKKNELKKGFVLGFGREREELRTDVTRLYEKRNVINGSYKIQNSRWNLMDYKQEKLDISLSIGPMGGYGNWIDSSKVSITDADHQSYGMRASADVRYWNRFYYDPKSYSLIDVQAWGNYDVYNQHSEGTVIDSFGVSSALDDDVFQDRFRYGLNAKAGFGYGRLSPMNHLMTAHYLLEKYYPGRIFSDYEIARFAQEIALVKSDREVKTGHNTGKEMDKLAEFVRGKMLLESPEAMYNDWLLGEFDPRYEGKRIEMGPFFKYYNKEPDLVYGGYLEFDYDKYKGVKWNQNIGIGINYNRYKKQDWMTAEVSLGWSYYSDLRSRFDFGVRYVPGVELNGSSDVGSLSHNVIPYLAYYSQITTKSRVKVDFSWRIADGEQFVLPGPEFSLAVYRSRY